MDGLSAGVGLISALFLLVVAILNGDTTLAFMLTALAGSLLGFLRYNVHPAKIYMGDSGALFIGLMLGALAMIGQYKGDHPVALLSPLLILGVPIFDTLFVMYIRSLRGLPMFLGSPDHMALRLRHWGLTVPQVVAVSYGATVVMGGVGLAVMAVGERTAWGLLGLTGMALVAVALILKKVDMEQKIPADARNGQVRS